jgi:CLIP-associating protein 1/2
VPGHPSKLSGSSIPLSGHPASMTNGHNNTLVSGSVPNLLQKRSSENASERSLESVLQASQQQVTAIETMLKGAVLEDKGSFFPVTQTGGNMTGDLLYLLFGTSVPIFHACL